MARLVGFFLLVLGALWVLRGVPVLGALFHIPFFGFWLAAIFVSALVSHFANRALERAKLGGEERRLRAVATPHNQGKLGVLLARSGRRRDAVQALQAAAAGEPDCAEWHYRLGLCQLERGEAVAARAALERALALDGDYAYGQAVLRLAEACTRAGEAERALELLAGFERERGPSPESAYLRGLALRALGRKQDARAALAEVGGLARSLARYQRRDGWRWVLRSWILRWS